MRVTSSILLCSILGACAEPSPIAGSAPPDPALAAEAAATRMQYEITVLTNTLGGALTVPNGIDHRGWTAGWSNVPGDARREAVLWRGTELVPLGTLGGPNSAVQWPGQSRHRMIVGIAELDTDDPRRENWSCSAFFPSVTHKVCRGFMWENGEMTALPTLGGTHGFAAGVNAHGQIVGWAETAVEDPTCVAPQQLQFRAVLWEPRLRTKRELRPWPGDSTSAATAINDRGQAVGISGACDDAVGKFSAMRAVMWDGTQVIDLGNLGGEAWHTPMAINERGEVVGFSNPTGVVRGTFLPHAFKWTSQSKMVGLDLLPGSTYAQAFGINAHGRVVGRSCGGAAGCRAVLWHGTRVIALQSLVAPDFPHVLSAARDVNDQGIITGNLVEAGTGRVLGFVAVPREQGGQ